MRPQSQTLLDNAHVKSTRSGKREVLLQGQWKNFYRSEKPDLIIQEFRHNKPGENEKETRELGALRNRISSYLFKYIDGFHIPNHFIDRISETEMLVKQLEMIPLTVRVFNVASNELAKRFGVKEGVMLNFPVIEHYLRSTERGVAWINEYHVYAFGIATPEEFKQINRITSKVNAVLRGLCDRRQLILAELQLEFGRYKSQVVLGDELSPVTCRFLDLSTETKGAKTRFVPGQNNSTDSYAALSDRLELKV